MEQAAQGGRGNTIPGGVQDPQRFGTEGTWFSGGIRQSKLTVGLDYLEGLFQPKYFSDSFKAIINGTKRSDEKMFSFSSLAYKCLAYQGRGKCAFIKDLKTVGDQTFFQFNTSS